MGTLQCCAAGSVQHYMRSQLVRIDDSTALSFIRGRKKEDAST